MISWEPTKNQSSFIKRFADSIGKKEVAIFAGAGLSRPAGYVDWRSLLREIANDLHLDIDRETDLIAVAQYHLNEKRNRGRLNQIIVDELAGSATPTRSHQIISRLPISTVWTTNYDQLLERSFEDAGKIVDVKLTQENLAQTKRARDVVLYKMHGCVTQPQHAVISKDDYEKYEQQRPLFVESLKGDLIAKTFLFLGFSFTDPNIDYILSRVRVLLGENVREHFCIMRSPERPSRLAGLRKAEYEYEKRKTSLRQADLSRFGIETVWIDNYSEVEILLNALSSYTHRKTVFVSGAAHDPDPFGQSRLDSLSRSIGARLISEGYNLVSGFGHGLGEQCVIGALHALWDEQKGADMERLIVRPFPRTEKAKQQRQDTSHREDLIARCGIVVVVAGNRLFRDTPETSPGVLEEVEIALREGKRVVPIGATGHAARSAWEKAVANPDHYLPGIKSSHELRVLGDPRATNDQLLGALFSLLEKSEKAARTYKESMS